MLQSIASAVAASHAFAVAPLALSQTGEAVKDHTGIFGTPIISLQASVG
jgi:hypothetical protein